MVLPKHTQYHSLATMLLENYINGLIDDLQFLQNNGFAFMNPNVSIHCMTFKGAAIIGLHHNLVLRSRNIPMAVTLG